MIDNIKLLLDIADDTQDDLINLLINICTKQAEDYTHREDELDTVVTLMVVESYNRLGSEGISSRSFSGISETPLNGYSENIIHHLNTLRKIRTI